MFFFVNPKPKIFVLRLPQPDKFPVIIAPYTQSTLFFCVVVTNLVLFFVGHSIAKKRPHLFPLPAEPRTQEPSYHSYTRGRTYLDQTQYP